MRRASCAVDEPAIEVSGIVDSCPDGRGGDLVEDHAVHRNLRVEHLEQVPGDGFALAVLIGGEIQLVR